MKDTFTIVKTLCAAPNLWLGHMWAAAWTKLTWSLHEQRQKSDIKQ